MNIEYYRKVTLTCDEIRKVWELPEYGFEGSEEINVIDGSYPCMRIFSENKHCLKVWETEFKTKEVLNKFFTFKDETLKCIDYKTFNQYQFVFSTTKKNLDKIDKMLNKKVVKKKAVKKQSLCAYTISKLFTNLLVNVKDSITETTYNARSIDLTTNKMLMKWKRK